MIAQFSIPGTPVPKGRARIAVRNGQARAYTPEKTVRFESLVALAAQRSIGPGGAPAECAVELVLDIWLPIPPSWSQKKKNNAALGILRPCGRPDVDNYCKSVMDGLNGIVFRDDSQVTTLTAAKRYSINPRVDVLVLRCNDD